jgi:hypothetical protein
MHVLIGEICAYNLFLYFEPSYAETSRLYIVDRSVDTHFSGCLEGIARDVLNEFYVSLDGLQMNEQSLRDPWSLLRPRRSGEFRCGRRCISEIAEWSVETGSEVTASLACPKVSSVTQARWLSMKRVLRLRHKVNWSLLSCQSLTVSGSGWYTFSTVPLSICTYRIRGGPWGGVVFVSSRPVIGSVASICRQRSVVRSGGDARTSGPPATRCTPTGHHKSMSAKSLFAHVTQSGDFADLVRMATGSFRNI